MAAGITMAATGAFDGLVIPLPLRSGVAAGALPVPVGEDPQAPFDCSRITELGIDKQMNLRAAGIMEACSGRSRSPAETTLASPFAPLRAGPAWGGADADAITGSDPYPSVSQNESYVWAEGNTVVVSYNDSSAYPQAFQGVSYSTNGGATFTRISP